MRQANSNIVQRSGVLIKASVLLASLAFLNASPASAGENRPDYPSYMILKTPSAQSGAHPTHGYSPGYGYGGSTNGYSYGWFGVQPRQHWSRHFGTYRNYTQWKAK